MCQTSGPKKNTPHHERRNISLAEIIPLREFKLQSCEKAA